MKGIATKKQIGLVVRIRVSPKDSMAVYDALVAVGLRPGDFTFPSAVSRFIANAAETFRTSNIIPSRDGFAFSDIMASFKDGTTAMPGRSAPVAVAAITPPHTYDPLTQDDMNYSVDPNVKFRRLMARKNACPDEWTSADEEDLQETMNAALGIVKGS